MAFKTFQNNEIVDASEMNENFRRVVKNRPDGGDYEVDKTIADYLNPVIEAISDETTAREDADTALQSNLEQQISDEAGLREDGDLANHNHINSEILNIVNGVYKVNRAEYADYFDNSIKSTDSTFASNSDNKIPTEKATKTYVDNTYTTIENELTNIENKNNATGSLLVNMSDVFMKSVSLSSSGDEIIYDATDILPQGARIMRVSGSVWNNYRNFWAAQEYNRSHSSNAEITHSNTTIEVNATGHYINPMAVRLVIFYIIGED